MLNWIMLSRYSGLWGTEYLSFISQLSCSWLP